MNSKYSRANKYLFRNIHGLNWPQGNIPLESVPSIVITSNYRSKWKCKIFILLAKNMPNTWNNNLVEMYDFITYFNALIFSFFHIHLNWLPKTNAVYESLPSSDFWTFSSSWHKICSICFSSFHSHGTWSEISLNLIGYDKSSGGMMLPTHVWWIRN